ncbi:FKBP-type peptidyl-prolyl cis-trans isomerase [Robbsia sp. Bb-Pol-6]|uniref:Peptidyl-prolyl cis-trans isomerase n=1 Tax=Robbsia betulipollinis TaxID=2981849 RepID=A0ABT3ZL13_9BURK|nr:FKBP-type peptidyl-prolyl cis-trans isomerase [Robbsia betulipollinis]MCY0386643.1 FKBP-type peptidyl-prolyl cis-trans isomerase [Robbsia betulipollinis]
MKSIRLVCAASLAFACFSTAVLAAAPGGATDTLPSGVTVQHLRAGTGASPSASDTVTVNYQGTLNNGTVFDSSYKRGEPTSFPLNRVVPCWTQGIQKMKVGEKARLVCPPATAYGDRGVPGVIPAGATLTFDVELLSIQH